VLLLPKDAILQEEGKAYVYALRDNPSPVATTEFPTFLAERVEIGMGLEDSAHVQVFRGLNDGDRVVINGQYSLKPGTVVRVMDLTSEIEAKADLSAEEALAEAQARRDEMSSMDERSQDTVTGRQ
jgi:hypothetical protein